MRLIRGRLAKSFLNKQHTQLTFETSLHKKNSPKHKGEFMRMYSEKGVYSNGGEAYHRSTGRGWGPI